MMSALSRSLPCLCAGVMLAVSVSACGGGDKVGSSGDDGAWKLVLMRHGSSLVVPLAAMNVYLSEDEFSPEQFVIQGDRVALLGSFPAGLRVGYGEEWKNLFGKTIIIAPQGNDVDGTRESFIELAAGERARVLSGTVIFDKLSGSINGRDGDLTLSGRIMLVVQGGGGTENLMGTIAVHCVTWG